MSIDSLTGRLARALTVCAAIGALGATAACGNKDTTSPSSSVTRTYDQIQRLGNPLVSEVFLFRRDHPLHGAYGPSSDVAAFSTELKAFVAGFRPNATGLQSTLASVLLPDMLIIQTDKAQSTAGWLSWALANGWGGRKLTDDVVDTGLSAIFSNLLDSTQAFCAPGALPLCTDNIGSHSTFSTTFPYLPIPN